MIHDVKIIPLRRIGDSRGAVITMLRADAPHFIAFGEIYFSIVAPNAIKAWKRHKEMTLNLAVCVGETTFVLQDDRAESPSRGQIQIHRSNDEAPSLLIIPPGVWNGFTNLRGTQSVIANCATILHDPAESIVRDPFDPPLPFDWKSLQSQ